MDCTGSGGELLKDGAVMGNNRKYLFLLTAVMVLTVTTSVFAYDCSGLPQWESNVSYSGGDIVQHNNTAYEANWSTIDNEPPHSDWTTLEGCARDRLKADNTTDLNVGSSWTGGTVPAAGDTAVWDNTVTAANTVSMGADAEWAGLRMLDPGGTVTINNNTLTLGAGGIDMSSSTQGLTLNSNIALGAAQEWTGGSGNLIIDGTISGSDNLAVSGGSINFRGANTYTGTTTISNGTLWIRTNDALGATSGNTVVQSGGTLGIWNGAASPEPLVIQGVAGTESSLHNYSESNTFSGTVSLQGAGRFRVREVADQLSLSGVISGSHGFEKTGAGVLGLSGNNTYTGTTDISAGAVRAQHDSALGTIDGGTTVSDGGALELRQGIDIGSEPLSIAGDGGGAGALRAVTDGGTGDTYVLGNIALTGASTIGSSAGGLFYLRGDISGGYPLTKTGTSPVVMTGNNTYTGVTSISEGPLWIGHANGLGGTGNGTTVSDGATLALYNGITTAAEPLTLNGTGSGSMASLYGFGTNTYTGPVNLNTPSTIGFNELSDQLTISGVISGTGSLTQSSDGTLILSGNNTYSGGTEVSGRVLRAQHDNALGTGNVTVTAGNRLELSGGITVSDITATINGDGTNYRGPLQSYSGSNTWAGPVVLGETNSRIGALAGSPLTVSGVISDGAAGHNLVVRNDQTGSTTLSGINTYGGETRIYAGTLRLGGNNRLPTSSAIRLSLNSTTTGILDLNGYDQEVGGIELFDAGATGSKIINDGASASTLTVNNTTAYTYEGTLEDGVGALSLTKNGTGNLVLTRANTYTGATTIGNGTLTINGSTAAGSGAVTVADGATLAGTGTAGGAVTVQNGGTLSPGDGTAAQLSLGSGLTINGTSVLDFELGTASDAVAVTGDLVLDGVLNVTAGTGFEAGSYTLMTYTGTLTDNTLDFGTMPGDYCYEIEASGGSVVLHVYDPTVGGSISGGQSPITVGDGTGTMTLSGHTGDVVQWQYRIDAGAWVDIAHTAVNYSHSPEQAGTYDFRAEVKNGTCASEFSSLRTITVEEADSDGGRIKIDGAGGGGFFDTHGDANLLNNPDGSNWTVESGSATQLAESGGSVSLNDEGASVQLINDFSAFNDGVMQVDFTTADWNFERVGFIFRWSGTNAYYYAYFADASTLQVATNALTGGDVVTSTLNLSTGTAYSLKIDLSGSTASFYLDDVHIGDFTDATHASGRIGYGSPGGNNGGLHINSLTWTDAGGDSTEVTYGESTGNMELLNNVGDVIGWERRLDGGTWESISHTADVYSEIPSEAGTWEYRAEVKNADKASDYSD
ncbi:MAG: autotransporter-associated beta strand repeat-containing protein, partial [Fibrobacterota bacterium]